MDEKRQGIGSKKGKNLDIMETLWQELRMTNGRHRWVEGDDENGFRTF